MAKNTINCLVSVGYNTKMVVPIEKVSTVLALLCDCPLVTSEWNGNESVLVKSGDRVGVTMDTFEIFDRDDYNAMCEALASSIVLKANENATADVAALDETQARG